MDLSIIIPVYNTKRFLKDCITPLIQSTSERFSQEILLIDNGSTDGSFKLAKEFEKKFPEIKVLKCATPGAAAVRNFGLKEAKGKYVWFIDSDDFTKEGAAEKILERLKKTKADILVLGAEKVDENGKSLGLTLSAIKSPLDDPKIKQKDFVSKFIRYGLAPWQLVCRREFLVKNSLFFDEGMIHEDMALLSSFILFTDKVVSLEEPVYFYRPRSGSVLHSGVWNEKELDIFRALEKLSGRFEETDAYKRYYSEIEYFYIWNLLDDAARLFNKYPEGKKHFQEIRKALRERFPNWRKNKYLKDCPIMVRARIFTAYFGIVW